MLNAPIALAWRSEGYLHDQFSYDQFSGDDDNAMSRLIISINPKTNLHFTQAHAEIEGFLE